MPDDTQLALASLPQPPVGARAAAARDDALVRLGADVYLIACAGCHADGHAASGAQRGARGASLHVARGRTVPAPAPDRLADAPMRARGGNAPVLSDEQIAALAAFLQRHATAIGPVRLDRPSTML
ncbi:MAG TPA: cytochrome c [Burkholderiaceae bacterium]|nr:cytochrome c [Burkholderiaceae bacterium]